MPNQRYSSIAIRKYIVEKYNSAEFRLLCHDDDEEHDHLGTCYDNLGDEIFEIKVLELVNFADRRNKFDKLVSLLRNKRKDLDEFITQASDPFSSKPTRANYRLNDSNSDAWAKRSNARSDFKSPVTQPTTFASTKTESPPQFERLHRDIEHLEENINSLGEIDDLLGNLDDLLDSMRRKIGELLIDIKVRHQRMQDEKLNLVQKPNVLREQKADPQANRSTFARQQALASQPTHSSSWGETQYSKPNSSHISV